MRAMQSVGLFAETPVPESSGGWGACLSTILDASGVEARDALEAFLNEVRLVGSTDDVAYVRSFSLFIIRLLLFYFIIIFESEY